MFETDGTNDTLADHTVMYVNAPQLTNDPFAARVVNNPRMLIGLVHSPSLLVAVAVYFCVPSTSFELTGAVRSEHLNRKVNIPLIYIYLLCFTKRTLKRKMRR